tara:strand:- start:110 stop:301 length:192 start_codon:yes stop_codon:yes gene_type:complete
MNKMESDEALKKIWVNIAKRMIEEWSPKKYTHSEIESVIIGVRGHAPNLAKKLKELLDAKPKK